MADEKLTKELTLKNKYGMHVRPAGLFAKVASRYDADVQVEKGNVKVVAHRGLSGIETENTNAAFVAAGNRSYYGIETDIHRTADGRFAVGHDDNFKRLSGEEIYIGSTSLAELENLVLFDKNGTKDRVDLRPSKLESYLNIVSKYEKHAVLELKSDFTTDEIKRIVEIIKEVVVEKIVESGLKITLVPVLLVFSNFFNFTLVCPPFSKRI